MEYQDRLFNEKSELDKKIEKLSVFLGSEKFNCVDGDEQKMLRRQLSVMIEYSSILAHRISKFSIGE